MSQTIEHDLPLLFDVTAEYDAVDCGFSRAIVVTEEGAVVARNFALARAAADLIMTSEGGRRTPLDLLEAIRMPLDASTA